MFFVRNSITWFQKCVQQKRDSSKAATEWVENQEWCAFGESTVEDLQTSILKLEYVLSKLTHQQPSV